MTVRNFKYLDATTGHLKSSAVPASQAASGDELDIWKLSIRGDAAFAGITMNSNYISGLKDPAQAQDAATKAYVDSLQTGFSVKDPVRAATTPAGGNIANLATGAPNVIDGVTLAQFDTVLVKDQTTQSQNGIYFVNTLGTGANGVWVRHLNADSSAEVKGGMSVFVNEGTVNGDTVWVLTTNNAITLGTTSLVFTQFSGLGQITAGNGLTKNGNTLDVGAGNGISVATDAVAVKITASVQPGLYFEADNGLAAKVDTTQGIGVGTGGIYLRIPGSTPSLAFTGGVVDVKFDTTKGLMASASGLALNINSNMLAFSSGILEIKHNINLGIGSDASGVYLKLAANKGLGFDGTGNLQTLPDTARGLAVDATGLYIKLDTTTAGLQFDAAGLDVKYSATGAIEAKSDGVGLKLNGTTLQMAAAGVSVKGLPSLFEINAAAVSANVTAANLNSLTGGLTSDAASLHTHSYILFPTAINAASNVNSGDPVYVLAAGTVARAVCDGADNLGNVVGISASTATTGNPVSIGILTGSYSTALTGLGFVAGDVVYLGTTAGNRYVTYSAIPSGARVIQVGIASTTTGMLGFLRDFGTKP